MSEQRRNALRVFLTNWLLIAALLAFNLFNYVRRGGRLSLIVTIVCGAVFIGWGLGYFFFFRKPE